MKKEYRLHGVNIGVLKPSERVTYCAVISTDKHPSAIPMGAQTLDEIRAFVEIFDRIRYGKLIGATIWRVIDGYIYSLVEEWKPDALDIGDDYFLQVIDAIIRDSGSGTQQ